MHVPFCRRRCRYCDFTSADFDSDLARQVVAALVAELDRRAPARARPMRTIFIGGGTPSILPVRLLETLLENVARRRSRQTEFSVEANPDSLSKETLAMFRTFGVNRLSIGVQSFVDKELRVLGRPHSARQAREALARSRAAGLENVSADLIYGIPGQTLESWRFSLQQAVDADVKHVSCYCLSYPEGTPLANDLAAGRVKEMEEDVQRESYELAIEVLRDVGLRQYEISNFARAGCMCRHNITYWKNEAYIGIGPGAASYVGGCRFTNVPEIARYVAKIGFGPDAIASSEELVGWQHMAETLMLMLRMRRGVLRQPFRRRFGVDPLEAFENVFQKHRQYGLVNISPRSIRLTPQGLFVCDSLFSELVTQKDPSTRLS